jgi:uncharacterized LabA/DUF88 family protein
MSDQERVRVAVFIDWQNTWHAAREAFGWTDFPNEYGNYSPLRLAELVTERNGRRAGGQLVRVNIHRGLPSNKHDPRSYGAVRRQAQAWISESSELVVPRLRPLRYYGKEAEPREKGVDVDMAVEAIRVVMSNRCDVAILFSHDTDLLPVIDAIAELKGLSAVETVSWVAEGFRSRLRTQRRIYHHALAENDFLWVEDRTNYAYKGG